jgi:hypothetical protein
VSRANEDFVRQVAIGVCAMLVVHWLTSSKPTVVVKQRPVQSLPRR